MIIQVKGWAQKTRTTLQPQSPRADWAFHTAAIWLLFYFCDTSRVLIDYQKNVFRSRVLSMVFSSCNTSRARSTFHPPKIETALQKCCSRSSFCLWPLWGDSIFEEKSHYFARGVVVRFFLPHVPSEKHAFFDFAVRLVKYSKFTPPFFVVCHYAISETSIKLE